MSDFRGDEFEFAAGSILGLRSWGMDDQGRLHGVTHREVWRPGENVSTCKKDRRVPCPNRKALDKRPVESIEPGRRRGRGRDEWTFNVTYEAMRSYHGGACNDPNCYEWSHPAPNDHTFDPNCECGFWAYDEHTFTAHGDVTGIIEGYGKTTIGTRGFRCEKARIVALSREHQDDLLSLSAWFRLQQLYPEAAFYEEVDEMVAKHGTVLRTWGVVGDDFWDKPVPRDNGGWAPGGFTIPSSYMQWAVTP